MVAPVDVTGARDCTGTPLSLIGQAGLANKVIKVSVAEY
jgi:hypothetical protein